MALLLAAVVAGLAVPAGELDRAQLAHRGPPGLGQRSDDAAIVAAGHVQHHISSRGQLTSQCRICYQADDLPEPVRTGGELVVLLASRAKVGPFPSRPAASRD